MAKVLFVVYVPVVDLDESKEAEGDNDAEEEDDERKANESQDGSGNAEVTLDPVSGEAKENESEEEIILDPVCGDTKDNEGAEESQVVKEEDDNLEQTSDKSENIFFKDVEKEDNLEKTSDKSENIFFKDVEKEDNLEKTSDKSENIFFKDVEKEDCKSNQASSEAETDSSPLKTGETDILELDKGKESKKTTYVRFVSELTLVEKVKRVLDDLNVKGVQWILTEQQIHVGMFVVDDGLQCEDILRKLSMLQIGAIKDSSVSVFPASISSDEKQMEEEVNQEEDRVDDISEQVSQFKNSIKSRLVVDQVVNAVKKDAAFTFDYLMLVILASFVALMGLLESSSVVLVASMLISPLMGPILAGVFGVVIRKRDLILVGIVNEIIGLTLCVVIGFVIGFIPASLEVANANWRSSTEWPTPEMSTRGALRALPVGVLIALPSGAGVALSILGGKVGSLVGVAISASLLPPAVNAGLLWANAIVAAISPPAVQSQLGIPAAINNSEMNDTLNSKSLSCAALINNDYEQQHFCNMSAESVVLGCVSLLLTILNIFCIILMGVIVLKIKEVAPIPHFFTPASETEFFCQDLRIARESNVTMKGQAAAVIRKEWLKTYQEMKSQVGNECDEESEYENELDDIIDEVERSQPVTDIFAKMYISPQRWSKILKVPSSKYGEGSKFDFSTPSPLLSKDNENGMSLRQRTAGTPGSTKAHHEDKNAVYYTVHSYIPSRDLRKINSNSFKSVKKLHIPKRSRFLVNRVVEDPAPELETVLEAESKTTQVQVETQPLLKSQGSDVV